MKRRGLVWLLRNGLRPSQPYRTWVDPRLDALNAAGPIWIDFVVGTTEEEPQW